jgi:hypothetical protein
MSYPWNVVDANGESPWVQGYIFNDLDSRCYNATTKDFLDQTPWAAAQRANPKMTDPVTDMHLEGGTTPVFATRGPNGSRGVLLDQRTHWRWFNLCPWLGTAVIVCQPTWGANVTRNLVSFSRAASASSNAHLRMFGISSSSQVLRLSGTNSTIISPNTPHIPDNTMTVAAFEWDIETRQYSTMDPTGTVTRSTALADATSGVSLAVAQTQAPAVNAGLQALSGRFGDMDGTAGTTQDTVNFAYVFELHLFNDAVLTKSAASMTAFINGLKTKHGIA